MEIERLECYAKLPTVDPEIGKVTGYAATFGKVGDRNVFWEHGAFDSVVRALTKTKKAAIPMLWQHDSWEPVGKWNEATVDSKGLLLSGPLSLGIQKAQDVRELLKDEVVTGLSLGFIPKKVKIDEEKGMRYIQDAEAVETSFVTFPAMAGAVVKSVQATIAELHSIRDWERYLREVAGLSQSQAKALLADGFDGLSSRDEGDDHSQEVLAAIERARQSLTLT
jgi:HK97 family phage prohead protease